MTRIVSTRFTFAVVAVATLLGGCGMFHHHNDAYYSKAQETKPLEVPPDLDAPVNSNELTVPAPGASSSVQAASSAAVTSTSTVSGAPPQISSTGDSLHVSDSVGHAWTRVGLALERAQVGTISERNETAHSYTLEVSGLKAATAVPTEHHWYSRILHPFGGGSDSGSSASVSGHVTITVSAEGDGARVEVSGPVGDASAAEAARRVLNALRERMS